MKKTKTFLLMALSALSVIASAQNDKPLRLAVAGLSHGHVWEVISRLDRGDFEVVGIAEKDTALWNNETLRAKVDKSRFFSELDEMLDSTKPEAVIVYESIYEHLRVVEACAPRGIHVMVEKPLATTTAQAKRIAWLAREHGIMVLTNYETTWYAANHRAYELIRKENAIGRITRINVHDGHEGPVEIGCAPEFLRWLTDPVLNGGGAVMDFGCYGANLSTWLMGGRKPVSVSATLLHLKPHIYAKVDDEATITLEYPDATVVIMASWNWPMSRKDMHTYGEKGYICQDNASDMRVYSSGKENRMAAAKLAAPHDDSFRYLKAAVRGEIAVMPTDLSSLENNLTVVEILNAAIESSRTGRSVKLMGD